MSFFLIPQNSFGINLQEALSSAYTNNPEFTHNKLEFLKAIEAYPQTFSKAFMPDIGLNIKNLRKAKPEEFKKGYTNELQKSVYITQNLFNGGGGVAAISAAKEQFHASKYKFFNDEQKIFIKNIKSYFNCYAAEKKYEASIIALNFTSKEYEAAKERLRLGESTKTDVAHAKMKLAESEYEKSAVFANLQSENANFYKKNGIDLTNEKLEIPEILDNDIPTSLDELIALASNNYNIKQKKHELKVAKSNRWVASSKLLPSVSLSSSYAIASETRRIQKRNDKKKGKELQIAISLNIPILPNGGAEYSNVRIANKTLKQAALAQDQIFKENEIAAISLWSSLNASKANLSYGKEGLLAAEMALEGTKKEYAAGIRNLLDVLKTERDLYHFKIKAIEATVQYFTTLYEMQALLGKLTAETLKLNVKYFNPDKEFNNNKFKIVGF